MIGLLNYNFCSDGNALDPTPTIITKLTDTIIKNAEFDHINITSDTTSPYSNIKPTNWDISTILDCDFNGNISGGNVSSIAANVTAIRIKRRPKGSFTWMTIKEIPVIDPSDEIEFSFQDNLAANNTEYEYAFVPVTGDTEGDYGIDEILSKFDGVFICDVNTIYKFYAGVEYGSMDNVQQVGVYPVMGKKYPIVISNSLINYKQGSFSGQILPDNYYGTGQYFVEESAYATGFAPFASDWLSSPITGETITPSIGIVYTISGPTGSAYLGSKYIWTGTTYVVYNKSYARSLMVEQRDILMNFLNNHQAKILKDWNGNEFLVFITGTPQVSFAPNIGMSFMTASAAWTEIGDPNNNQDMFNNGLIPMEV